MRRVRPRSCARSQDRITSAQAERDRPPVGPHQQLLPDEPPSSCSLLRTSRGFSAEQEAPVPSGLHDTTEAVMKTDIRT